MTKILFKGQCTALQTISGTVCFSGKHWLYMSLHVNHNNGPERSHTEKMRAGWHFGNDAGVSHISLSNVLQKVSRLTSIPQRETSKAKLFCLIKTCDCMYLCFRRCIKWHRASMGHTSLSDGGTRLWLKEIPIFHNQRHLSREPFGHLPYSH